MKPTLQERINMLSDDELREALKKREKYIKDKKQPVIELNNAEMSYRCVEAIICGTHDGKEVSSWKGKGYLLQFKWWQDDEWIDVTDLSELKVWEYNQLVEELHKHYPDYLIEHLEGRFV